jgi:SAM-dependent methyltransferase
MADYYSEKLSADRLKRCYDLAPPRVRRYLAAEIEFVASRLPPATSLLELGCGYGRVLGPLLPLVSHAVGIDTSGDNLRLGDEVLAHEGGRCRLIQMDASHLAFRPSAFDVVICVQNGISAFHVDPVRLISEAIRVTKPAGKALFSSYSTRFWKDRLEWFVIQSDNGLLGEIDFEATGNGVIVCKDGFAATTTSPENFQRYGDALGLHCNITEVDNSSLFCEYTFSTPPM